MEFTTLEVSGSDAVRLLEEYRSKYRSTGQYPFLIGDGRELGLLEGAVEYAECGSAEFIRASLEIDVGSWIAERRQRTRIPPHLHEKLLGEWPIEVANKGSITLHKDWRGEIKPKVYLGLAKIEQPWQLPAVIRYGG
jgi:hypothetical protein